MDPSWKTSRGRQVQSFWELISVVGVIQEMAWVTDTSTVQVIHLLKKYTDRHNSLTLFFGTKVNYCFAVLLLIAYFLSFWSSAKRSERNEIYKASVSLSILHCGLKYRGKSRESSPQKWNIYIKKTSVFCLSIQWKLVGFSVVWPPTVFFCVLQKKKKSYRFR